MIAGNHQLREATLLAHQVAEVLHRAREHPEIRPVDLFILEALELMLQALDDLNASVANLQTQVTAENAELGDLATQLTTAHTQLSDLQAKIDAGAGITAADLEPVIATVKAVADSAAAATTAAQPPAAQGATAPDGTSTTQAPGNPPTV